LRGKKGKRGKRKRPGFVKKVKHIQGFRLNLRKEEKTPKEKRELLEKGGRP